jgi:hypothetical protein
VLFAEHQLYARCLSAWVRRESSPEWLADQVRTRAMALPEVDEVSSHGMPCFGIVKGKKFAYVALNHHSDGRTALLVKISGADEQAGLIEQDEDAISVRPISGTTGSASGWTWEGRGRRIGTASRTGWRAAGVRWPRAS